MKKELLNLSLLALNRFKLYVALTLFCFFTGLGFADNLSPALAQTPEVEVTAEEQSAQTPQPQDSSILRYFKQTLNIFRGKLTSIIESVFSADFDSEIQFAEEPVSEATHFVPGAWFDLSIIPSAPLSDFRTNLTYDAMGIDYENTNKYLTLNIGGGRHILVSKKGILDFYADFAWTHLTQDPASDLSGLTKQDYLSILRTRVGGRFLYSFNSFSTAYFGLAYDKNFLFQDLANTNQQFFSHTVSRRDSAYPVAELGFTYQPNDALSIKINGIGITGDTFHALGMASLAFTF
jgi:hypothetical protein